MLSSQDRLLSQRPTDRTFSLMSAMVGFFFFLNESTESHIAETQGGSQRKNKRQRPPLLAAGLQGGWGAPLWDRRPMTPGGITVRPTLQFSLLGSVIREGMSSLEQAPSSTLRAQNSAGAM